MATFKDLDNFFKRLDSDYARRAVPRIIAEKATEFYKDRFRVKADPDEVPWQQTQRAVKRGSLMVRSGKTMASIKPSVVTPELVTISSGGSKVPQAKIHNEGGEIVVTQKMKKFFWAKSFEAQGGLTYSVKAKSMAKTAKNKSLSSDAEFYKAMALKKVGSTIKIPKRQYMGHSKILNAILLDSFKKAFHNLFSR